MSRQQTKAIHYIQQLNDARCDGNWEAVPELVRKVRKHAPERSCLTLVAESEYAVEKVSGRPSTPSSSKSSALTPLIQPLLEAIEKEKIYIEDDFQARVCLGWIYFVLGEPAKAVASLPKNVDHDFAELDGTGKQSTAWTRVCAVKGAFLKGTSHAKLGSDDEALLAYDAGMPILAMEGSNLSPELKVWTEHLLLNACLLYSKNLEIKRTRLFETETLAAFRSWGKFWEIQFSQDSVPGGFGAQSKIPRRYVWQKYYLTLSSFLQKGVPYPSSTLMPAYVNDSTKVQQRAELERVETIYESLLLNEVEFPKAEEASEEVELWVAVVTQNWTVLCSDSWQENELAQGGREATSRRVLDILYRAATKTFHSTPILRYLFLVHLAIADFDLAFKAFDTYLDIVKKGKAREEKTGEIEHALDDDETVLLTATECIRALCRYGSRQGAEKAGDIGRYVETWLKKHSGDSRERQANGNGQTRQDNPAENSTSVSMDTISKAWLSVGISQAQWARFTYESTARSDIQKQAIDCFRKSLSVGPTNSNDVETLFALGTLLAERRELDAAIEVVKSALLPSSSTSNNSGPYRGEFAKERSLIPLWHLLALLLSARQEFTTAARSCEGAFEQFRDPTNLFGHSSAEVAYRSEHLNEKSSKAALGVVDVMEDFEKETILEVKITQLALIEILEGPEVAVNASDELLSLYARLFGDPDKALSTIPTKSTNEPPPRSSAGTIKTISGSIFRRASRSTRRHSKTTTINEKSDGTAIPARPQTSAGKAPAIQVTNEVGSPARQRAPSTMREPSVNRQEKLHKTRNRSSSAGKPIQSRNSIGPTPSEQSQAPSAYFTPANSTSQQEQWADRGNSMVGVAISSQDHYVDSTASNSTSRASQPQHQTERTLGGNGDEQQISSHPRSVFRNPATRFSKAQERRRRLGLLVKLWLLVAGFYRRAAMLDDANVALLEARKLVEALEVDVAQEQSGDISVENSGWGGGKSVEELWGDVWAERGYWSLAKGFQHTAQLDYEAGLSSFPDHPLATIGLSNLLLDAYAQAVRPSASAALPMQNKSDPALVQAEPPAVNNSSRQSIAPSRPSSQTSPLGLPVTKNKSVESKNTVDIPSNAAATSTALLDRLAGRDRAYGLLSALTKTGKGWNNSEAWFTLARAYEEGGQIDKSRECLWWCIELEEARAVRSWDCVATGGYVL